MEKVNIAWELVGQIAVGIGVLVALVQGFKYLWSESAIGKLEKEVSKNKENRERDYRHLERIDNRLDMLEKNTQRELDQINDGINILGSSMASMINHMVEGDGIDRLKEERDKLVGFFIKRD